MTYLFLFLSAIILVVCVLQLLQYNKEYFTNFSECRKAGYTKEFCVQTPVSAFGPSVCQCADGTIGKIIPGMQGECYCGNRFF